MHLIDPQIVDHLQEIFGAVLRSSIRDKQDVADFTVLLVNEVLTQRFQLEGEEQLVVHALEEHLVLGTIAALCIDGVDGHGLLGLLLVVSELDEAA